MGSFFSRQNGRIEELDDGSNLNYVFPPTSGSYFANHFFMGGKKFETAQPEGYLFGDNADLNYLGPKPHNMKYQMPQNDQPVRALKCLVNIRKDSLRLIRAPNPVQKPEDEVITNSDDEQNEPAVKPLYNLEFTFDADCPCAITVYYNAMEVMEENFVKFTPNAVGEQSDTVHYNAGCNQQFCVPGHVIDPSVLHREDAKPWDPKHIPIAIQVGAECGPDFAGHSHITYATFDKLSDGGWNVKATKQKQAINGVCYLFQEIYGIENKRKTDKDVSGDVGVPDEADDDLDDEDDSSECVVCLSDMRDTLILPCKHLCLCSSCANQLRFQQSGCPICRQPFRALLQIRAVRKKCPLSGYPEPQTIPEENEETNSIHEEGDTENGAAHEDSVPPGYEVIPLISAINGPVTSTSFAASLSSEGGGTRAGSLRSTSSSTSSSIRRSKRKKKSSATIGVENETTSVDVEVNRGSERRRTRSRRKKKSDGGDEMIKSSALATEVQQSGDNPLHVYVNEGAVVDVALDNDDTAKGCGDHFDPNKQSIESPHAVATTSVDFDLVGSAGDSTNQTEKASLDNTSVENETQELFDFSPNNNSLGEERL